MTCRTIRGLRLRLRPWRLALAFLALILAAPVAQGRGVNDEFTRARIAFERGQYARSQKMLKATLKRFPAHGPSLYLMGRLQFRAGNEARAVAYFKQSGRDFLEGEGAFDYGLAFYQVKDFREAINGFSVIRDRRIHDIAAYYLGMSHYRLGEYVVAERALAAAADIPKGKAENRDRVLAELRQKLSQGMLVGPSEMAPIAVLQPPSQPSAPPPSYGPPAPPVAGTSGSPSPPPDGSVPVEKPAKPKVGTQNSLTPRIKVYRSTLQTNFGSAKKEETSTQGSELGLTDSVSYSFRPDKNGKQSVLSLGVDVAYVNETVNGRNVQFSTESGDQGEFVYAKESLDDASGIRSEIEVTPGAATPISKDSKLIGGLEYAEAFPELLADKSTGSRAASLRAETNTPSYLYGVEAKYKVSVESGSPTKNDTTGALTAAPLLSFMALDARLAYKTTADGKGEVLEGPQSVISLDIKAAKPLDFGITFGGSFGYAVLGDVTKTGLAKADPATPPTPLTGDGLSLAEDGTEGVAAGKRTSYSVLLKVEPIEWLSGGMELKQASYVYDVADAQLEKSFLQSVRSNESSFNLYLSVQKSL